MTATTASTARTIAGMTPLRLAYEADGIATLLSGVAVTALAAVLDEPLGLSFEVLLATGVFFIAYAVGVLVVATRRVIPRRPAAIIVGLNIFWTVDSLVTLAAGWLHPTALGTAGILFIAAFTAAMAAAQIWTLRTER